jgi:hypothetical protein
MRGVVGGYTAQLCGPLFAEGGGIPAKAPVPVIRWRWWRSYIPVTYLPREVVSDELLWG